MGGQWCHIFAAQRSMGTECASGVAFESSSLWSSSVCCVQWIFFGLLCAVCSVSHFAILFKNVMTMIYKSLREVCTTSRPCTLWSNSSWSTLNSLPYFSPLTRGSGCKRNKPSSVAWCLLIQLKLTRSGWNTNERSSVAWWPFSKLTRGGTKQTNSVVVLACHCLTLTKQTNSVVVLACHCLMLTKQTNSVVVLACHWSHWITKLIH